MIDFTALPIEEKIGQLFFIGISGPTIDAETAELLAEVAPGGVCLFARNIREPEQVRDLLRECRSQLSVEPFLSLDQEGGLVDRLRRIVTPMPAASKIRTTADARRLAAVIAKLVRTLGFNMDFAPVVDVIDPVRSAAQNGLYSRAFGESAAEVIQLAGAFLSELEGNGCIGCLKHFPGLGASKVDSHEELPVIDITQAEFAEVDLAPYCALLPAARVPIVMAAHAVFPGSDLQEVGQDGKLLPTSLSFNFITGLLRNTLGHDGVVLTDDLEMGAIVNNFGIAEACKLAIAAGEDMVTICADPQRVREGYQAISEAVRSGEISEERLASSLYRIAQAKAALLPPLEFDGAEVSALSADVAALNESLV
jgi:beta-N-acetylhexosaminidase